MLCIFRTVAVKVSLEVTFFQMLIGKFFGESGLNNRVMYFKLLLKSLVENARDDLDRDF